MLDCIIVGAGPGGVTTAYHLAKKGHSVLVLDKASLPRSKPCGGGVSPAIAKWFDFDFTPVIDNSITQVQYTWKMGDPVQAPLKNVQPMWMVERSAFDSFLVEQAVKQGAIVKPNTEVTSIQAQSNGWQVNTKTDTFAASYLIGADGVNGPVAQWLGLGDHQYTLGATLEVPTSKPPEYLNRAYFEFGLLKNGYIWNFPKSKGYTISGGILRGNKANSAELKQQIYNYATEFGLDTSKSSYCEYPLALWRENRTLHTQRALIVGEAAAILDPLTAEGIRPSIWTGIKAANAVSQSLQGDTNALAQYTEIVKQEWGADMVLAQRLAGIFYQFPKIAYKVGVKRPAAAQIMGKILCGELKYGDITEQAVSRLKKSLIPGMK
ncbi:geranylgeranyl reductase family protein [Gloeocapsa sp. PCC 73106]|uniref:geranylgeranyl reductase family protein n=1 Tax=Gloeocapsa sp. PCC 73106 TaxID=102232 RepID=UPI0002ABAE9F|nr:geranylgeranyl reductase family protein [Gloeocapsa sp. PCC 73106]ELR96454.1 geranylgeranyl reductase family protein [Gloeocapsa sp. PCC 73106]